MLRNELYRTWVVNNDKDNPNWGIEIIDGEFSGVALQIVNLKIEDNTNMAQLDYHVIRKPDGFEDNENGSFRSLLEIIMMDILKEALELVKNEKN